MSDYLNVLLTITINPFMLIIIAGFIFTCIIERRSFPNGSKNS